MRRRDPRRALARRALPPPRGRGGYRAADGVLRGRPRERRFRDGHPARAAPHPREPVVRVPRGSKNPRPARAPATSTPSATSSSRLGSPSSCGAASRTTSCWRSPSSGKLERHDNAACASAADACRPESARRSSRTSRASGCTCATSTTSSRTRTSFRTSTTTCGRPSSARPSCSSRASLNEDRSLLDLMTADYTFVDERLAQHYGIPQVYGSQLPPRRARTRARGAPRLARQGRHPDGDVARRPHGADAARQMAAREYLARRRRRRRRTCRALETAPGAAPKTMRERLESHRANPSCAGCHQLMDPLGFAMENFDAVGGWRDTRGRPAPSTRAARSTDGTAVDGAAELREALLADPACIRRYVHAKSC